MTCICARVWCVRLCALSRLCGRHSRGLLTSTPTTTIGNNTRIRVHTLIIIIIIVICTPVHAFAHAFTKLLGRACVPRDKTVWSFAGRRRRRHDEPSRFVALPSVVRASRRTLRAARSFGCVVVVFLAANARRQYDVRTGRQRSLRQIHNAP